MTKHAQVTVIPERLMHKDQRMRLVLYLAAMNLLPDATYTAYRDWCDKVGTTVNRQDIDTLCGNDFNVG